MPERKSYAQFCGLARSLDHVGDRWTLLIVRELLLGPATFAELLRALPGIATNLLTRRLRNLRLDGLATRSPEPRRSKAVTYELTERGRDLEPAILALIRWGSFWMTSEPGDDRVDPRWAPLALRALLADPHVTSPRGALLLGVEGEQATVIIDQNGRRVLADAPQRAPRAHVRSSLPTLLAVASGALPAEGILETVYGDEVFIHAALTPWRALGRA